MIDFSRLMLFWKRGKHSLNISKSSSMRQKANWILRSVIVAFKQWLQNASLSFWKRWPSLEDPSKNHLIKLGSPLNTNVIITDNSSSSDIIIIATDRDCSRQVTLKEESNQQVRNLQNQLEEEQRQAQNRFVTITEILLTILIDFQVKGSENWERNRNHWMSFVWTTNTFLRSKIKTLCGEFKFRTQRWKISKSCKLR